MSLFSIGKNPTGSKDPFALRRAALGIVRIAIKHKLSINFVKIVDQLAVNYKNLDKKVLVEFFNERLFKIFDNVNPSVLKAVISSKESDIYKIYLKIEALNPIVQSDNFKDYVATFKRVANIIKDIDLKNLTINEKLFQTSEEKELYIAFNKVSSTNFETFEEEIEALFGLKLYLDNFFENVFVNAEDEKIRVNRKNLIGLIYKGFRKIADIKEITI